MIAERHAGGDSPKVKYRFRAGSIDLPELRRVSTHQNIPSNGMMRDADGNTRTRLWRPYTHSRLQYGTARTRATSIRVPVRCAKHRVLADMSRKIECWTSCLIWYKTERKEVASVRETGRFGKHITFLIAGKTVFHRINSQIGRKALQCVTCRSIFDSRLVLPDSGIYLLPSNCRHLFTCYKKTRLKWNIIRPKADLMMNWYRSFIL